MLARYRLTGKRTLLLGWWVLHKRPGNLGMWSTGALLLALMSWVAGKRTTSLLWTGWQPRLHDQRQGDAKGPAQARKRADHTQRLRLDGGPAVWVHAFTARLPFSIVLPSIIHRLFSAVSDCFGYSAVALSLRGCLKTPHARLTAPDTACCGVLGDRQCFRHWPVSCVLASLGPTLASRTRGVSRQPLGKVYAFNGIYE